MPILTSDQGVILVGGVVLEGSGLGTPLLMEGVPDGTTTGYPAGAVMMDLNTGNTYVNTGDETTPVWVLFG